MVRFIPLNIALQAGDFAHFGTFELHEHEPNSGFVRLESLLPYKAAVTAPTRAILESNRVFIPGYVTSVDGTETPSVISRDGLVAVPVNEGIHRVTLFFTGSKALRLSYWVALASWALVLFWGALERFRLRNLSALSQ